MFSVWFLKANTLEIFQGVWIAEWNEKFESLKCFMSVGAVLFQIYEI